jgi:hypothetical protein
MTRITYVHYDAAGAAPVVAALRKAGHAVRTVTSGEESPGRAFDPLPQAVVVSLAKLPSHGRAIVEWLWEAKYRQVIPVVFVDGAPDKVAVARRQFPAARFGAGEALPALLRGLPAARVSVPRGERTQKARAAAKAASRPPTGRRRFSAR